MKKILAGLILLMMLTGLAGCGPDSTQPPAQQTQTAAQATADTSDFIGEENAKKIALERADLTADDVVFDRTELDRDNGIWQYEIEFRRNRTEYDVKVKADDGVIISYETDAD